MCTVLLLPGVKVSTCVLFVCKCVLYYCHRVSTQFEFNISYCLRIYWQQYVGFEYSPCQCFSNPLYVLLTPYKVPLILGIPSSKFCLVSFAKVNENRYTQTHTLLWEIILHGNFVRMSYIFLSILLNSVDEISQEYTQFLWVSLPLAQWKSYCIWRGVVQWLSP
jgi:hypothetical protein